MMAPATVLVPLDGSTNATAALSVARGLAHLKGATVVLIHVGREALAPDELLGRMRLSAEDVRGLVIDQCTGSPAEAIVREAAARHTVLIVMCAPARPDGPLHGFGSVLGDVLRTAPCPVVLVPSIRGRHPWALRQLVLPHDGTPTSAAAIAPTADLASRAGADLVVLHVATPGAERPAEFGDIRCAALPRSSAPRVARVVARVSRTRAGPRPSGEHREDPPCARAWGGQCRHPRVRPTQRERPDRPRMARQSRTRTCTDDTASDSRRQLPRDRFPRAGVMMPPEHIDLRELEAFLFDLDGVVTRTASVHATAWKRLFDDYLERRARAEGAAFVPFDPVIDYQEYVDGRPREAGVRSFLAARGISLPPGSPDDGPEVETLNGLGKRKDQYFVQTLAQHGVEVYDGTVSFVRDARARGVRTAIVSSSQNCAAVLDAAGLTQLFDVRVDGIDLRRLGLAGKPAPDMFLEAARQLEDSTGSCRRLRRRGRRRGGGACRPVPTCGWHWTRRSRRRPPSARCGYRRRRPP